MLYTCAPGIRTSIRGISDQEIECDSDGLLWEKILVILTAVIY